MTFLAVRPAIPYHGPIPGGLHEGKIIEVKGSPLLGAQEFSVNLMMGLDSSSDRALHLGVRFRGRVVTRNALQGGSWGAKERSGVFPFNQGEEFTLTILVNPVCYFISVNGIHCWKFNHRLPTTRVSTILIDGHVNIEHIQCIDKNTNSYQFQPQVVYPVTPVTSGYVVTGNLPSVSIPASIVPPPAENPYLYPWNELNLQPDLNTVSSGGSSQVGASKR